MLQKTRMPQIRGGKGEAVLTYCELLPTKEIRYHTAFPKGKKQRIFLQYRTSSLVDYSFVVLFFIISRPYWIKLYIALFFMQLRGYPLTNFHKFDLVGAKHKSVLVPPETCAATKNKHIF